MIKENNSRLLSAAEKGIANSISTIICAICFAVVAILAAFVVFVYFEYSYRGVVKEFEGQVLFVERDASFTFDRGFRNSTMNELEECGTLHGLANDFYERPDPLMLGKIVVAKDGIIVIPKIVPTNLGAFDYCIISMRGPTDTLVQVNALARSTGFVSIANQNNFEMYIAKTADSHTLK